MAIACYLAMTAAEMRMACQPSAQIAWMACHFSPYGTGLSNLPKALPLGSVLMVNDRTPIHGHDPEWIGKQLRQSVQNLGCRGVLLDFQRPEQKETAALVAYLVEANAFPMAVSQSYAAELDCPIFLPPVPLDMGLETYLMPWQGREIWLELALDGMEITLTETGAVCKPLEWAAQQSGRKEEKLHCHYRAAVTEQQAQFHLWRTKEDLQDLLVEAENLGVAAGVGLYQELGNFSPKENASSGTALTQPEEAGK